MARIIRKRDVIKLVRGLGRSGEPAKMFPIGTASAGADPTAIHEGDAAGGDVGGTFPDGLTVPGLAAKQDAATAATDTELAAEASARAAADSAHAGGNRASNVHGLDTELDAVDTALAGKQPLDTLLTNLAALTTAADQVIYWTGSDTPALTTLTSQARQLLDDTSFAAMRATLGVPVLAGDNVFTGYLLANSGAGQVVLGYDGDAAAAGKALSFWDGVSAWDVVLKRIAANELGAGANDKFSAYGLDARSQKVTSVADGVLSTDAPNMGQLNALIAAADAMVYKGARDCSANPNYPAADAGHTYKVSVAGKIGGASGPNVEVGDTLICTVDGTAAGTHAAVGANWNIVQVNIDGAVVGPSSATDSHIAAFDGATGKLLKDGGVLGALAALGAGTNLESSGGNLRIAATAAGDGLTGGGASPLAANPDGSTLEISADALRMKDGGTTLAKLATALVDALFPWSVDIDPFATPHTQTGYSTLTIDASQIKNGYKNSGVQNDEIGWDVNLAAGTWTVSIVTLTAANQGILTVSLDGSSVGTIDLYTAGTTYKVVKTITGISVASSGKKRLLFKAATKNASSSGYVTSLSAVALRRTA